VVARSIGGAGGAGGEVFLGGIANSKGDGGASGNAGTATILSDADITTSGSNAHGLGVVGPEGRGAAAAAGIAGEPDVVLTLTLSKSLGAQGGAVLGNPVVVDHLVNTARAFIFDTGLAPSSAAAASAALDVLRSEPGLAAAVRARARGLAAALAAVGLPVTEPTGAVVSVLVGDPGRAFEAAARLRADGIRVGCFRPPSVPDGVSRLRLTARADLTDAQVSLAVQAVRAVLADPALV
jgi:8-amino-7-oxononanoate synthase